MCIFDVSKLSPNQDFKKAPLSDSKLSLLTKKNVKNYLNSRKKSQKDVANNKKERSKKSVKIFMTQSLDNKNKPDMEYPRSIFLIIATEFCERFSFCGLRSE